MWEGIKRIVGRVIANVRTRLPSPDLGAFLVQHRDLIFAGILSGLITLAVIFIGIARYAQNLSQQDAKHHATHYEDVRRADTQRRCVPFHTLARQLDCGEAVSESAREHQRDEYTLQAERDEAIWTKATAEATFVAGLVGVLTVMLLYETLKAQRRTIQETARIGEAQTRAYLSISSCKVSFNEGKPHLKPTIRNSGQSPALAVRWHAMVYIAVTGAPDTMRAGTTNPEYRNQAFDIPTQGEREALYHDCGNLTLIAADAAAIAAGQSITMLIDVFAEGKDVFGKDIKGADEFLRVFQAIPNDLDEFELILSTQLKPDNA